jgi:hypothetical protein
MLTYDEQRKKLFKLECSLGEAIKLGEQAIEEHRKAVYQNSKLVEINATLFRAIKEYVNTPKKEILLNVITEVSEIAKDQRLQKMDYEPVGICDLTKLSK